MYDISIIIPVYNAELTIERAIISIFSNRKLRIEVIVVDDGSNDNTYYLLERLKSKYPSLVIISQNNSGPSIARKAGIELARGNYITFVDADDYLEDNAYDKVSADIILNKIDIIEFSYRIVTPCGNLIKDVRLSSITCRENVYCQYVSDLCRVNAIWNKIFHRTLFTQIEYPLLKIGEDLCLNLQLMFNAKSYVRYSRILYNYIVYKSSLSHDIDFYKYIDDIKAGEFFLFFNDRYANHLNDYALVYLITKIILLKESMTDKSVLSLQEKKKQIDGLYNAYTKRFYFCISHRKLLKYYISFKIYDYLGIYIGKVRYLLNGLSKPK